MTLIRMNLMYQLKYVLRPLRENAAVARVDHRLSGKTLMPQSLKKDAVVEVFSGWQKNVVY